MFTVWFVGTSMNCGEAHAVAFGLSPAATSGAMPTINAADKAIVPASIATLGAYLTSGFGPSAIGLTILRQAERVNMPGK
jgi:hypothetical protein